MLYYGDYVILLINNLQLIFFQGEMNQMLIF